MRTMECCQGPTGAVPEAALSGQELDLVRTPDGTFKPERFEGIFTGMSWLERIAIGGMAAGMLITVLLSLAAML